MWRWLLSLHKEDSNNCRLQDNLNYLEVEVAIIGQLVNNWLSFFS